MSALADPWVGYEGDVKQSVEEFRSSFGKFEALQRDGRPDEVQHAQKELLSQLKTLNWDMDDLSDAIKAVEKNRAKYKLDDVELQRRRDFVSETRAAIGKMKSAVQDATASSGGALSHTRNELLRGRSDRGGGRAGGGGGGGGGGYGDAARDVESGGSQEQQQLVMKQQDMVLDDVIQATKRLGEMGQTIGDELGQQSRLIDEVKDDVDETNNKLKLAQDKVEKLLSSQSESRLLCLVCMLIGVFITLCLFVFYF